MSHREAVKSPPRPESVPSHGALCARSRMARSQIEEANLRLFMRLSPSNRPPETINLTIPIISNKKYDANMCSQSIPGLKINGASAQSEIF